MIRRIFFIFLFILSTIVSFAETSVWDGSYSRWTKGIGLESDPFVITSAKEFAYLSQGGDYEGKYFVLESDLDLNDLPWTPIGYSEGAPFKGYIDFQNHKILGVNVNLKSDRAAGLFGYIENATIKNVDIEGSIIGVNCVGGIVGFSKASYLYNLNNHAAIFSNGNFAYVGGIVGYGESTNIISSTNHGDVINTDNIQDNSHSAPSAQSYIGGIVGYLNSNSSVNRCCNKAPIRGYSVMATANYCVSGISGIGGNISYCYNTSSVTCNLRYVRWGNNGTKAYVAGIATSPASLNNCYNTGAIIGCSYWGGRYAGITTGPSENIDAGANNNFSTWNITGCQATSYTAQSEKLNGVKVSLDDINKMYLINELNTGTTIFKQDIEPYLNNELPYIDSERLITVATKSPININLTSATIRGIMSYNGYNILKTWFEFKEKGNIDINIIEGYEYADLLDLKPNTSYISTYCVETNDFSIYKGGEIEFQTKDFSCEVYTLESIEENGVIVLKGALIPNDDIISSYGFEYKAMNTQDWSVVTVAEMDSYYFSSKLTDLSPNSTYQYRAYANINGYRRYGEVLSFSTLSASVDGINNDDICYSYHDGILRIFNLQSNLLISNNKGQIIYFQSLHDRRDISVKVSIGMYIINGKKVFLH